MNDEDWNYWYPIIVIAILALLITFAAPARSAVFPSQYDYDIRRAAKSYLPSVPWRLYKAQLWQESRLDPTARSPAGAEGIAQFMPATAGDILPLLGYRAVDRRAAGPAIQAGAYYMARLRASWAAPRSEDDRHKLALASYNAGMGNLLRSQQHCGNPATYDAIMACLPQVTGRHAAETLAYAPRIYQWFHLMVTAR